LFYSPACEDLIDELLEKLIQSTSNTQENAFNHKDIKKKLGHFYFRNLYSKYSFELTSFGGTMLQFYNNLNCMHEQLFDNEHFGLRFIYIENDENTGFIPTFTCHANISSNNNDNERLYFDLFTIQEEATEFHQYFFIGMIEESANLLWNLNVKVKKLHSNKNKSTTDNANPNRIHLNYRIALADDTDNNSNNNSETDEDLALTKSRVNFISGINLSKDPNDLLMSMKLFNATYPFSLFIDKSMRIIQIGDGFISHIIESITKYNKDCNFFTHFTIISPLLNQYTFTSLKFNYNMIYRIKLNQIQQQTDDGEKKVKSFNFDAMELKGSLIYLEETDCILFIGSPVINDLEELINRGLYMSDVPIHDATRDIILVKEQTKVQVDLKANMENLKISITKAHQDIEEEKHKNIQVLNALFPSRIAKKLWMGEKIAAKNISNVTLLYSDIVGFTSICSISQPIEVIHMLKSLYTEFDNYCGLLNVYKIETIGDAYIVAGGLDKPNPFKAESCALMGFVMLDISSKQRAHTGEEIKVYFYYYNF
jgi:hypothetical protein